MPPASPNASARQAAESRRPDVEQQHRLETRRGAEAFSIGDFETAGEHFCTALSCARRLFIRAASGAFSSRKAARLLISAQHNVAENFMRQGRLEDAYTHYLSAFSTLCDWLEAQTAPAPMRRACAENLSEALGAVASFLQRTGAKPERISAVYARAARHSAAAPHAPLAAPAAR